jgi:tRNA(Ile)-lysidine synthase
LLGLSRSQVLQYLTDLGQDYRIDETNSDTRWTRNRLRHELLPMLRRQYNFGVDDALLRLAAQAGQTQQMISVLAQRLADECAARVLANPMDISSAVAQVRIERCRLAESPLPLVREVCRIAWQQARWPLQAMGYEQWQQMAELISGVRGTPVNLPANVRGRRDGDALILERMA